LIDQDDEPPSCISSFFGAANALTSAPATAPGAKRVMRMTPRIRAFRRVFFPEATDAQWSDWHWQLRNRIHTLDQLRLMVNLTTEERVALEQTSGMLPAAITPHYMG
jgi:lysine 2,3-aminomutase